MQTAVLSLRGFPLYEQISLNKPPLLTWWLQLFFHIIGPTVEAARLAILLLSTLGLVTLGALAAPWWGHWAGPLTLLCFLLLPDSLVRGTFATHDIPGMTLMIAALFAATLFRHQHLWAWAALSGACFGLGVGIHPLLIYMLAPVGLVLLSTAVLAKQWTQILITVALFGCTVVAVTLAWFITVTWDGFAYWVINYNTAPLDATLSTVAAKNGQKIATAFQEQIILVLAAVCGGYLLWRQRPYRFWVGISLIWLIVTVITLSQLQPMWEHYLFFITYPLVLLAGGGLMAAIKQFRQRATAVKILSGLTILLFAIFAISNLLKDREWGIWPEEHRKIQSFLQSELEPGSFIISDEPFLVFASGHLVPPSIADSSTKRIATGFLGLTDVVNATLRQQVPYGLWGDGRFQQLPALTTWAESAMTRQKNLDNLTFYHFENIPLEQQLSARLEPGIYLLGYTIHPSASNDTLTMTLFWQTEVRLPADYNIFLHILDDQGHLLTQYDGDPLQGWLPTTAWETDVVVPHTAVIPLPPDIPASYTIVTGMYTWPDVVRLAAFNQDGSPLPQDLIPVTTVTTP